MCKKPCTYLNIRLAKQSKSPSPGTNKVNIFLYKEIEVINEVMPKSGLMVVAEIGGYLGLTLGISLLDLKFILSHVWIFLQETFSN